jgi:hypothetical protein
VIIIVNWYLLPICLDVQIPSPGGVLLPWMSALFRVLTIYTIHLSLVVYSHFPFFSITPFLCLLNTTWPHPHLIGSYILSNLPTIKPLLTILLPLLPLYGYFSPPPLQKKTVAQVKMGQTGCPGMSVINYLSMLCNIPEDLIHTVTED